MKHSLFLVLLTSAFLLFGTSALANELFEVAAESVQILESPKQGSKVLGKISKGRRIRSNRVENDFFQVRLKSGKFGWISSSGVVRVDEDEAVLENENKPSDSDNFKRWNFQLGLSSGESAGVSYTEVNLGIGYYFMRWLEFHNALFASLNRVQNIYGLDSSLRGVLNTGFGQLLSLHAFAGPGYRFASDSAANIPFFEAGLISNIAGFSLGGGVRTLLYSTKDSRVQNENQYFIILSGQASL